VAPGERRLTDALQEALRACGGAMSFQSANDVLAEAGLPLIGHGERSRLQLRLKLAGAGNMANLGLAVQVWLLST